MQVLIPQKIAPPYQRGQLTSRPHLCQRILGNLDCKVSLISAPAGYGKTSLALELSCQSSLTTCWYHLDARDSNLDTFYSYLCETLAENVPGFRANLPQASPDESAWGLAGLVTSTLYKHREEPLLLILDNFHEIDGHETLSRFVDALITYLPPTCHLLILSRTSTDLNLARLIAQQDLNLITSQDLRLSLEEASSIASHFDLDTSELIKDIYQKVDGWVAGFTLLASRRKRQGPNLNPEKLVRDYLKTEFFDGLSDLEQRFALHSAVIAPFTIQELNHDFGQDLKDLIGHFVNHYQMLYEVKRDAQPHYSQGQTLYTYTPLVQSFLTEQLEHRDPSLWQELNVRIGERRWAEGRFEGLEYLAKAKRYDLIIEKLANLKSNLIETGDWRKLGPWLQDIPEDALQSQGELLTILAETEVMSRPAVALGHYQRALETQKLDARTRSLALVGSLRATYKLQRFQEVIGQSEATLAELAQAEATKELAQAYSLTASAYLVLGDYAEAKRNFDEVTSLAEEAKDSYLASLAARGLGAYADFVGDARQATVQNKHSLAYWEERGNSFEVAPVLNNLASNYYYLGDLETALQYALRALSMHKEFGTIGGFDLLCCTLGDIYQAGQQLGEGEKYYQLALRSSQPNRFAYSYALQGLSALLVQREKLSEAEAHASQALTLAREHKLQLLEGLAQLRLGQVNQQHQVLEQAARHFDLALKLFTSLGAQRELGIAHLFKSQVLADETLANENLADENLANVHRRKAEQLEMALGYPLLIRSQAKAEPTLAIKEPRIRLKVQTLGQLEFQLNGATIPVKAWNGRKPRDIVLFLASRSHGASRDQIIDALWKARGQNLEQQFSIALSRARRALGQEQNIIRQDQLYMFAETIFLEEDAQLIETTPPDAPDRVIKTALEHYQGDYLPGYYANWVETRREQLRTKALLLFGAVLEHLGEQNLHEAPELASRALTIDPCHEASHRQLIRYYLKHQGVTPARRQYAQYLGALGNMGLEPSPAIKKLLNA